MSESKVGSDSENSIDMNSKDIEKRFVSVGTNEKEPYNKKELHFAKSTFVNLPYLAQRLLNCYIGSAGGVECVDIQCSFLAKMTADKPCPRCIG